MSASKHYEKISLTKQDLAHVYKQFINAVQDKAEHFMPVSGRDDPLRVDVENLVIETITEVFEMAKWAIIVDGNDFSQEDLSVKDVLLLQPTEEVMPFDTQLNLTLRGLIQEVERETTEVTRLRRELPERAKDAYDLLVTTTDQEVTALLKSLNEADEAEEPSPELETTVPNADDLTKNYEESILRLQALKRDLPEQITTMGSWGQTMEFLDKK